jgi:HEPN domain-containing protein
MREEAKKWFQQALEDLSTAKDTFFTGHAFSFLGSTICRKGVKSFTH